MRFRAAIPSLIVQVPTNVWLFVCQSTIPSWKARLAKKLTPTRRDLEGGPKPNRVASAQTFLQRTPRRVPSHLLPIPTVHASHSPGGIASQTGYYDSTWRRNTQLTGQNRELAKGRNATRSNVCESGSHHGSTGSGPPYNPYPALAGLCAGTLPRSGSGTHFNHCTCQQACKRRRAARCRHCNNNHALLDAWRGEQASEGNVRAASSPS